MKYDYMTIQGTELGFDSDITVCSGVLCSRAPDSPVAQLRWDRLIVAVGGKLVKIGVKLPTRDRETDRERVKSSAPPMFFFSDEKYTTSLGPMHPVHLLWAYPFADWLRETLGRAFDFDWLPNLSKHSLFAWLPSGKSNLPGVDWPMAVQHVDVDQYRHAVDDGELNPEAIKSVENTLAYQFKIDCWSSASVESVAVAMPLAMAIENWEAFNEVLRTDDGDTRWEWSSTGMYGSGEREIPEKTHRSAESSGTISTCDPGRNRIRFALMEVRRSSYSTTVRWAGSMGQWTCTHSCKQAARAVTHPGGTARRSLHVRSQMRITVDGSGPARILVHQFVLELPRSSLATWFSTRVVILIDVVTMVVETATLRTRAGLDTVGGGAGDKHLGWGGVDHACAFPGGSVVHHLPELECERGWRLFVWLDLCPQRRRSGMLRCPALFQNGANVRNGDKVHRDVGDLNNGALHWFAALVLMSSSAVLVDQPPLVGKAMWSGGDSRGAGVGRHLTCIARLRWKLFELPSGGPWVPGVLCRFVVLEDDEITSNLTYLVVFTLTLARLLAISYAILTLLIAAIWCSATSPMMDESKFSSSGGVDESIPEKSHVVHDDEVGVFRSRRPILTSTFPGVRFGPVSAWWCKSQSAGIRLQESVSGRQSAEISRHKSVIRVSLQESVGRSQSEGVSRQGLVGRSQPVGVSRQESVGRALYSDDDNVTPTNKSKLDIEDETGSEDDHEGSIDDLTMLEVRTFFPASHLSERSASSTLPRATSQTGDSGIHTVITSTDRSRFWRVSFLVILWGTLVLELGATWMASPFLGIYLPVGSGLEHQGAAQNNVLRIGGGEERLVWRSAGMRRGREELLEKIHRPAASSGTIPTCGNPGSDPAGN
ncbi:hypothetical protein PR048_011913 [Dryococelus australis]|uniref:Uncharacterized protein n=1 Tax=Dryococelus australis TaxID=614101 RepID=A0ABQ9HNF2_9NEOP|nr:hypothetical protein PR048_011913 [Dryococelus australis]